MRTPLFLTAVLIALLCLAACSDNELLKKEGPTYPMIDVSPPQLDFGELEMGMELVLEVTISSIGDATLEISEMTLDAPATYELDAEVTSFQLHPGQQWVIPVRYTADGDGHHTGDLRIVSNDIDRPEESVILTAQGLAPAIEIDPPSIDFGDQIIGCPVHGDITVRSVGTAPLTIHDVAYFTTPSATAMWLDAEILEPGMKLDPGEEVTISVGFEPEELETYEGLLSITSDDPHQLLVEADQVGDGAAGSWINDHFVQEGNNQTDILWVIDNSCSMSDEQGQLADDFAAFYDIVNAAGVDYHISVVTTDNGEFQFESIPVIDPSTPDGAQVFADNCSVGIQGSGYERGLMFGWEGLRAAVDQTYPNGGFFREDAGLRVVFLSDEPDQSGSWSDYLSYYQSLKINPDHVVLSAIVGTDGINATSCSGNGGSASAGTGYVEAVNASGGILASICDDDWSQALTNLGWISVSLADTFELSKSYVIESTIDVRVNGVSVSYGWTYDGSINSVVFDPSYVPEDGDTIDINYGITGGC